MAKYSALRRQLETESSRSVEMTFDEVDTIVGGLPRACASLGSQGRLTRSAVMTS